MATAGDVGVPGPRPVRPRNWQCRALPGDPGGRAAAPGAAAAAGVPGFAARASRRNSPSAGESFHSDSESVPRPAGPELGSESRRPRSGPELECRSFQVTTVTSITFPGLSRLRAVTQVSVPPGPESPPGRGAAGPSRVTVGSGIIADRQSLRLAPAGLGPSPGNSVGVNDDGGAAEH